MFLAECAFPACSKRSVRGFEEPADEAIAWLELADGRWLCPAHKASAADQLPASALHPLQREFGFAVPEDGSGERYATRLETRPWLAHSAWWFVHNCIAHPLIGVFPRRPAFRFHDWTSRRMHGRR